MSCFSFELLHVDGSKKEVKSDISELVIAGWAGRDESAIEHHIEELAAIGVPRPSKVPLFYRVTEQMLSQSDVVEVLGNDTSGEVEPLLLVHNSELFISISSDHTDRKLEAHSVALSKQICVKPIGAVMWRWEDVKDHWDDVVLRSLIVEQDGKEVIYQEGNAGSLLRPDDLLKRYFAETRILSEGLAMTCGTVATIGDIRPAERFKIQLYDPVLKREISHTYKTKVLPIVE